MGRRRQTNLDLPPRLYLRGLTHYYVDSAGKWHNLGPDRARALRLWAEWEGLPRSASVADIVNRFLSDCMGPDSRFADSTRNRYADYARTIERKFADREADSLTRFELARWRDGGEIKRGWFNGCLSLLRVAYRKAGEWGWAAANPAEGVAFNETTPRGRRITDDEFRRIRESGPRWLQTAMDLAYLTSLRESDVIALRWAAVGERLSVVQVKTGVRQAFEITPPLRAVLEAAKRIPIVGLFVVATDKGRPITARRLQRGFAAAVKAAGVDPDTRFHDIRGMSATAAEEEGLDYQAMLGHTSKKMSDRYLKKLRTIRAPTLMRRL